MSGGSYEYLCFKITDMADRLVGDPDPIRSAFGQHLRLVADAAHDVEWVDSCDMGKGDEHAAILAVLGTNGPTLVLEDAIEKAESVHATLAKAIERGKERSDGDS